MIRDLSIKNYRCFEDFYVDGLAQVNLIVGDNNSGKTSFLEAIHILLDKSYYYKVNNAKTALIDLLESRKEFIYEIRENNKDSNLIKIYLIQHLFSEYTTNKNLEILCNYNKDSQNIYYKSIQILKINLTTLQRNCTEVGSQN